MQLDLMKLFDGYVRNYHTFNLTVHHGKHSFTMTEIEYFSRLGSMLGYFAYTEDTCNGTNRPMDLTWWDNYDGEYWHDFALHLERENYFRKDEETLDKLFCEREYIPANIIGIMNVRNHERIEELLLQAKTMCKVDNALLIFKTTASGNSQKYFDQVYAYLLNKKDIIESKIANVSDISGTLYMYYDNEK
ncbi:hypothetical protein JOD29_003551 [Lysinibacillus composti]|uniref:Uncharacterized protein n=1 Tax=Lysinibacillus composti TaxID=720633 RepID=A0A3N9UBA5_9BACI|nr:hypothetical protein [Lysinibacillus composti]MBM7610272.1 hypothetical protein [Lysinibacillus composti]RQW73809.1 hypothetical protein EBB45_14650 [Lysinibacillus composti]